MRRRQFALRSLLVFVTLACVALTAWHQFVERPRQERAQHWAAIEAISAKGCDLHMNQADNTYTVFFKNQNVTDADLAEFLPAFHYPDGWTFGSTPVRRLNLNGSAVSAESVRQFEQASGIEVLVAGVR